MPEEIERILELTKPSAPESPAAPLVSKSARISRACGFLALGSVVLFWLMFFVAVNGYENHGGDSDIFLQLLAGEGLLLLGLSLAAITCAIIGLAGAKRHSGNWKVAGLAIVLTLVAVAGFIVPLLVVLSQCRFSF